MAPAALRIPRLVSYFVTWCLAVVAGAAALNGLVKSRHDRDRAIRISNQLSGGLTSVKISIDDSLRAGGFLAAGQLLLSLIAFHSALCLLLASLASPSSNKLLTTVHRRTERRSTMLFALGCWVFAICWTFGAAVALTDFGVNRDATVWLGGHKLDKAGLKALEGLTGQKAGYWIHGYTKFAVITPWPLLFFAIISAVLTFLAYRQTPASYDVDTTYNRETNADGRESSSVEEMGDEKKAEAGIVTRESPA